MVAMRFVTHLLITFIVFLSKSISSLIRRGLHTYIILVILIYDADVYDRCIGILYYNNYTTMNTVRRRNEDARMSNL